MDWPIKLLSTDFDGTVYAEQDNPPLAPRLQELIGEFQKSGGKWLINTGRDMTSLMEALQHSDIQVRPDFLVLVEREIHQQRGTGFVALEEWNSACTRAHEELFRAVLADLPRLRQWIRSRFDAELYEDAYSPLCFIATNNADADQIHAFLDDYCRSVPDLMLMRNDVYARLSHRAFNKGTALAELTRRLGLKPAQVCAAGDHFNDLPMLKRRYAHFLAAPHNAMPEVKEQVRREQGYLSRHCQGRGIAEALEFFLGREQQA